MSGIRINRSLIVPDQEIELRFTPSGGPGGQHANKASTRVELSWNVPNSPVLGPRQRQRITGALRNRMDKDGTLRLSSDRYRSQLQNRNDVTERFRKLVHEALIPRKTRVPSGPSHAAKERRLQDKKRRSAVKRARKVGLDDI